MRTRFPTPANLDAIFEVGAAGDEFGLTFGRNVALEKPVRLELSQLHRDQLQGAIHLSGVDVEQNNLDV